jgi:spore coat protein A, manganese oxidase
MSTTRRQFLKLGVAAGAGIVGYSLVGEGWAKAATRTSRLASFTQPLQVPPVLDMTAGGSFTLTATHLTRQLHPRLPQATNVWSYVSSKAVDVNAAPYRGFLGPTVVVRKGTPVTATYRNGIDVAHYRDATWLPCDRNFTQNNDDAVRLLTHLHGGFVHGQMDGNPAVDVGYTQGQDQTVWYGNDQRAGLIWYHDHGMGNTRLNVWSGLAGAYVLRDEFDTGDAGSDANHLPCGYGAGPGHYEVPLIFQDRVFVNSDRSGDLLYPTFPQNGVQGSSGLAGNPPYPYGLTKNGPWTAEAFGDEGLVNGLVAPFLNVEPRLYRFRCLNGCNARILDLQMVGGGVATPPPMYIIGTDGGMLPAPVKVKMLTMMPGERYDVLVDFKDCLGKVQLKNTNLDGFYTSPAPRLVDFLQFNVGATVSDNTNNTVPTTLVGGQLANPFADPDPTLVPSPPSRTINMWEMNPGAMHW